MSLLPTTQGEDSHDEPYVLACLITVEGIDGSSVPSSN